MEEAIRQLANDSYRLKVLRARRGPQSRKMGWGAELFAEACERMRSGIRSQFPDAGREEVEAILKQRLQRLRKLEEHGVFRPVAEAR
ncbi:MAG: hypothetical protein ABI680_09330 [Chthoniobacteraceae bacterium]